ncbi:MAG: hypothetical protein H6641_18350 [Caldilineaceae bacterium]|nr:hypothetical protein [Caldilineaceae bacterium]
MSERLTVMVEDGITEKLIELAGSSRKQGEYINKLVNNAWAGMQDTDADLDVEALRLQLLGLSGQHKALEGRVLRLESQLSAVMARGLTS